MIKKNLKYSKVLFFLIPFLLMFCDKNTTLKRGFITADLSELPVQFDEIVVFMEKRESYGDSLEIKDTISVVKGKFKYNFTLKQPKSMYIALLKNKKRVGELAFEDEKSKKGIFISNPIIGNENIILRYIDDENNYKKHLPKNIHIVHIDGAEENRMYQKTFYTNLLDQNSIKKYPYSISILWQMVEYSNKYSSTELQKLSSGFSSELKKTPSYDILKKIIKEKKELEENGLAKNFNWVDVDGKEYNFKDVINGKKNVLIIFWASWCVPCRKEIPDLKEFYNVYNRDINLVSLSIDEDYDKWKKAVDQENMPWLNLSGLPKNKEAIKLSYDIKAVPTLLLLDSNGKIIERNTNDLARIIKIVNNKK